MEGLPLAHMYPHLLMEEKHKRGRVNCFLIILRKAKINETARHTRFILVRLTCLRSVPTPRWYLLTQGLTGTASFTGSLATLQSLFPKLPLTTCKRLPNSQVPNLRVTFDNKGFSDKFT